MSLKSWKREFYRVDADSVEAKKNPIKHSIKKWEGLLKKNLKKHKLRFEFGAIWYGDDIDTTEVYEASIDTCALCQCYSVGVGTCIACPLYQVRGNVHCYSCNPREDNDPYGTFLDYGDARLMLMWLRRAEKMEKAKVKIKNKYSKK